MPISWPPDFSKLQIGPIPGEIVALLFAFYFLKDPILKFIGKLELSTPSLTPLTNVEKNTLERGVKDIKRSIKYSGNPKCTIFFTNNDGTIRKIGKARPYFTSTGTLLFLKRYNGFLKVVVIEKKLYETNYSSYITILGNSVKVIRNSIIFMNPYFKLSLLESTELDIQRNKWVASICSSQLAIDIAEIQSQNILKSAMERVELREVIERPMQYRAATSRAEAADDPDSMRGANHDE